MKRVAVFETTQNGKTVNLVIDLKGKSISQMESLQKHITKTTGAPGNVVGYYSIEEAE